MSMGSLNAFHRIHQRRQEEQREKFCRVVAATPVTFPANTYGPNDLGKTPWLQRGSSNN